MLKTIRARLAEPSTWGGISALLLGNAMIMGAEYREILGGLALLTGAMAILLKENK